MYQVVRSDKRVNGEITARNERTMVVKAEDGYTYVCELVGKPGKRKDFSIEGTKRNFDNAAKRRRVKVIEPNGTTEIYDSVGDVANTYLITRQTVRLGCKTGNATRHGKAKGFRFSYAD